MNKSQPLVEGTGGKMASGWVIESRCPPYNHLESGSSDITGGDEWVEIGGWDSVQKHSDFRGTKEYSERHDPTVWGDLARHSSVHLRILTTK